MTRLINGNISAMPVRFRLDDPVRPAACSRGRRYVRSPATYSTIPPQTIAASHSRTYRSLRPVFAAISPLVTASICAIASKRPTRRPTSSMMETAAPSRWRTISWVKAFAFALSRTASSAMTSDRQVSTVDDQLGPGDVRRLVRREEQHGVSHLFHTSLTLHRHGPEGFLAPGRVRRRLGGSHRRHDAGMHGVDADAVLRELHGGRLGHDPHGSLGRVVGHVHAVLAHEARDRRDVDDGAAARLAHGGHRVLHA